MRICYDGAADALYVWLDPAGRKVSRTVRVDPGAMVDLDETDMPVGFEIIALARPWPVEPLVALGVPDELIKRLSRVGEPLSGRP